MIESINQEVDKFLSDGEVRVGTDPNHWRR